MTDARSSGSHPDPELIEVVRSRVRDQFGSELTEKATPEFLLAISGSIRRATGDFALEVMATSAPTPRATIVEFAPETAPPVTPAGEMKFEILEILEKERSWENSRLTLGLVYRDAQVRAIREEFYRHTGRVTDQLESAGAASTRGVLEGGTGAPAPGTYTCWLNRTVRTAADPSTLADVAADPAISRLDVPRRLEAELSDTPSMMGVPAFRDQSGAKGDGVIVGVIDQEVALEHPALGGRVIHRQNYTAEPWGNPGPHGTGVAGIVGADGDVTGMAPNATIYNYKVLALSPFYDTDDFFGARAIQDALEDGVHVVNCSWGVPGPIDGTSRAAAACNAAWGLGLVIIKSAGNKGHRGPSSITTPADAEGVISVGATDRSGSNVQGYGSRGPTSDGRPRPHLLAPGGSEGDGVISLLPGGLTSSVGNGTSFAAPHVAGIAALLVQLNPNASPSEIRDRLMASCATLPGVDVNVQGAGLLRL